MMNKRTPAALLLILLTGIVSTTHAQLKRKLSLPQAMALSITQNKEIQRAKLHVQLAEEEIKEQKEQQLPDIGFHAAYARITDLTSFPTGFKNVVVDETIPEWADLTASGSVPLYQGGAIKKRIKKAQQGLKVSEITMEKTQSDIKMEVVANFLGIFKLIELQKLIKENIHEEEDRLKEVRAFRKRGTVTTNEVLRAELQLSDMQVRLLSNKHRIDVALFQLKTLLQLPEEDDLDIDTARLLATTTPPLNKTEYLHMAMQKDEMRIAAQQQAISKTELALARTNFLPKISFIGAYAANYPNYMFFPPQANTYTYGKIGLEATWSLSGLYKNKTKVHIAHLNEVQQDVNADIVKNKVMDNVFAQHSQLQELQEQLPLMISAQQQAAENYRIVKVKYLYQLVLITEMIDADNALLKARFNLAATKIDTLMKHYELRYAAGLL